MKTKQTAVEYLVKEFSAILGPIKTGAMQDLLLVDAIEQAKAMEKKQIMDSFDAGYFNYELLFYDNAEQYYEETYGK